MPRGRGPLSNFRSSTQSSAASLADDAADQTELEAAEVLKDLAKLATREKAAIPTTSWGSKGKRLRKIVHSESPPNDSRLIQERVVQDQQHAQAIFRNITIKPAKTEQDDDSLGPSVLCAPRKSPAGGSGRGRHNLTEAEKEERRIRRVLANRESARQTIRRRQALCEELTRKASELSSENATLKREKDLALREYQSLDAINKCLKDQMSKVKKKGTGKDLEETMPSSNISASPSTTSPLFVYKQHPYQHLCWPAIIQSSHPIQSQHGPHNSVFIHSSVTIPASDKLVSSQELENHVNNHGPRTPIYIMPGPWFFPLPDHGNGHQAQPSFCMRNIQYNILASNHSAALSSLHLMDRENQNSSFPVKVKEEACRPSESRHMLNDLNVFPAGFPHDGSGHHTSFHSKEPLRGGGGSQNIAGSPIFVKQGSVSSLMSHYTCKTGVGFFPTKNQGIVDQPSKKVVDTIAAAEARKRRIELTRKKNQHPR